MPSPAENVVKLLAKAGTADGVDERVVAAVAHGEPVRHKKHQVDELVVVDAGETETEHEVEMVGEPADTEDNHNGEQHQHRLPLPGQGNLGKHNTLIDRDQHRLSRDA